MIIKYGATVAEGNNLMLCRSGDAIDVSRGSDVEFLSVPCGSRERAEFAFDHIMNDIANRASVIDLDHAVFLAGLDAADKQVVA